MAACAAGNVECARVLIQHGADVNRKSPSVQHVSDNKTVFPGEGATASGAEGRSLEGGEPREKVRISPVCGTSALFWVGLSSDKDGDGYLGTP